MSDKNYVDILRNYARAYTNDNAYDFNPGVALQIADKLEKLSNDNEKIAAQLVLAENDIRLALQEDDICALCKYMVPCEGKHCDCYQEGRGGTDDKGKYWDFEWSCMDFNFGTCGKLENTPCNGCDFKKHWKWRESE